MTFQAKITVANPAEMRELGRCIGERLRAADLVLLTGELGAGKTTLTRGIGDSLGVRGPVTSPTFVLARTHPSTAHGPKLVHIDAYRLQSSIELEDLDIDYRNSVVVAEWGDGLLETGDSYLRLVINRPTGADDSAAAGAVVAGETATADDVLSEPAEELIEPRTIEITAAGSRWTGAILQQLIADFAARQAGGAESQSGGAESQSGQNGSGTTDPNSRGAN